MRREADPQRSDPGTRTFAETGLRRLGGSQAKSSRIIGQPSRSSPPGVIPAIASPGLRPAGATPRGGEPHSM